MGNLAMLASLTDPATLSWIFSGSLLFGIIAFFVGNTKGHGCLGCILGLLLGPFGLLITALLHRRR